MVVILTAEKNVQPRRPDVISVGAKDTLRKHAGLKKDNKYKSQNTVEASESEDDDYQPTFDIGYVSINGVKGKGREVVANVHFPTGTVIQGRWTQAPW